jgi:hypothetical protein
MPTEDNQGTWRDFIAVMSLVGGLLGGPLILALQIIGWLKIGHWPAFTVGDLLVLVSPAETSLAQWIVKPQCWYGLHSLIVQAELSITVFLLGPIITFLLIDTKEEWNYSGGGVKLGATNRMPPAGI